MRKQENMHRECPILGCSATLWVLNIKTHLARCHPTVPLNTVDLIEWVAVSQDDENKKKGAKKLPGLMRPKITLKGAQAVDNGGASYSEASLGPRDWEWRPEEDASSTESGSAADLDSSSGDESSASLEDGNSSLSSSSSGVELFPKREAVKAKGTKRSITTPMHNAKTQYTVKTPGRKK